MVLIYEPLYRIGQELAEPAFRPLAVPDNAHAGWREFRILVDMYRRGLHRHQPLTGLFSPKFRTKAGIRGAEFVAFVEANPGADVYVVNPYPQLVYLTFNVWTQGAGGHPGIVETAQRLLDAVGIDWGLDETPRHGPETLCYSNYWVGTEKFWTDYVGGILEPIAAFLESNPTSSVAEAVMAETRYGSFPRAPFLPFIAERLFSTYLSRERPKVRAYLLDPVAACHTDFERDIVRFVRDRVDAADRQGVFPEELKRWFLLFRSLRRRFNMAYFARHPHPETGEVYSQAFIDESLSLINAEPPPEPLHTERCDDGTLHPGLPVLVRP